MTFAEEFPRPRPLGWGIGADGITYLFEKGMTPQIFASRVGGKSETFTVEFPGEPGEAVTDWADAKTLGVDVRVHASAVAVVHQLHDGPPPLAPTRARQEYDREFYAARRSATPSGHTDGWPDYSGTRQQIRVDLLRRHEEPMGPT